jgi:hypothetical protein
MHVVAEMGRIVLMIVVLTGGLAGLLGCGARTRSSPPRATSMLPARTPDGLVSIPWTFGGLHGDTVSVRYNDSACGFSFAHTEAVESSQMVTIAVYDRYQPLGPGVACSAFLRIATAPVRLRTELDERTLVHAPVWRP